jgi:hypothetical protein
VTHRLRFLSIDFPIIGMHDLVGLSLTACRHFREYFLPPDSYAFDLAHLIDMDCLFINICIYLIYLFVFIVDDHLVMMGSM